MIYLPTAQRHVPVVCNCLMVTFSQYNPIRSLSVDLARSLSWYPQVASRLRQDVQGAPSRGSASSERPARKQQGRHHQSSHSPWQSRGHREPRLSQSPSPQWKIRVPDPQPLDYWPEQESFPDLPDPKKAHGGPWARKTVLKGEVDSGTLVLEKASENLTILKCMLLA